MSEDAPQDAALATETRQSGYRVLARKYRPKDFSDLMVGQEPMVRTLTNAFETGRIAQAYMLTGVRGVGKTTTARILARALNYKTAEIDRPTIDLRVPGEHCQAIMEGRHVDVIEMDAASHTGIDDIREIIEQVRYRPVSARYKVYIIDEVHMLSTQAFNGLLKTLEEPPEHVKFIFATTEIRKVPITVLSRCQRFDLRRISASDLVGLFTTILEKEGVPAEAEALAMVARAAEGSARDGLSLLDQAIAHGNGRVEALTVRAMLGLADRARIVDLFRTCGQGRCCRRPCRICRAIRGGRHAERRADRPCRFHPSRHPHEIRGGCRGRSVAQRSRAPPRCGVCRHRSGQRALAHVADVAEGIPETENAARPAGAAEMVLIRLAHAANLPSPEDAVRRLLEIEGGATPAGNGGGRPAGGGPSAMASGQGASARASAMTSANSAPSGAPSMMAAGEGGRPTLVSVGETRAEAAPRQAAKPQPSVPVNSAADIVELCARNRDIRMKTLVRNYLRLVRLEPGRLELNLAEDAPKTFVGELHKRLEDWTGIRWMVIVSREAGEATPAEQESEAQEKRVSDARQDPDVAAILARFPGARITDVRIKLSEAEAAADEDDIRPPAAAESAEGDILPGDDIDF